MRITAVPLLSHPRAALLCVCVLACGREEPAARVDVVPAPARFSVEVRAHPNVGRLDSARADVRGGVAGTRCNTCHQAWVPGPMATHTDQLDQFHKDMEFQHGPLGCNACHDDGNREQLRLAGGERIPMADAMRLCAQCHGPQHRDYSRGSHGGMSGYWDLSRGPRVRNHCLNCHDPHVPAWRQVLPAPPPRDRFLTPPAEGAHHD